MIFNRGCRKPYRVGKFKCNIMKKKKIDFNQYADRKLDDSQLSELKGGMAPCPTPICECWPLGNADAHSESEVGYYLYKGGH